MRAENRLAVTIIAPPIHSRKPIASPASSQAPMAAKPTSESMITIARLAGIRTRPYWTMRFTVTSTSPTTASKLQALPVAGSTASPQPKKSMIVPTIATPANETIDFVSIAIARA